MKHTYNVVDDRDSTYTFYQEPYATVLDPRTDVEGTYHVIDHGNVTPDQLMKYISTYLYFEEGEASQSEDFPAIPEITLPTIANIHSFSMVNCSHLTIPYLPFEYFCFNSLCSAICEVNKELNCLSTAVLLAEFFIVVIQKYLKKAYFW